MRRRRVPNIKHAASAVMVLACLIIGLGGLGLLLGTIGAVQALTGN